MTLLPDPKVKTAEGADTGRRTALTVRLEETNRTERRRACRALLQHPLLTAEGELRHEYLLVRRHADWLADWFRRWPDWRLVVDTEVARLRKAPSRREDMTRPAHDPVNDAIFTRRRYVLFCLSVATLERSDRQTTLTQLADGVIGLAGADIALAAAGMTVDLALPDHRRDLVQAVRLLLDLRALVKVEGDEQQYVAGSGDVLYNVRRPVLASILCVQRPPSTVEAADLRTRLAAAAAEPDVRTDEGRNHRLRTELVRRLIEDPVVYYDELSDEQRAYLHGQRHLLLRQIEDATGLISEIRREGIAMVDEEGDLTDAKFPGEGTEGHLALLLAEFLASEARRSPGQAVCMAAIEQHTHAQIEQHRRQWRRDATEPGAETAIAAIAVERLAQMQLVRLDADGVLPLPAIARFASDNRAASPGNAVAASEEPSLWGEQS